MICACFWLLQDLLCVLTWGAMRMPEIFIMSLIYRLLLKGRDVNISVIWTAFGGGLLWDLRWYGLPGIFTLSYVFVVLLTLWAWNALPVQGRTPPVILMLFIVAQLIPSVIAHVVAGGYDLSSWTSFFVQQLSALPLVLLCTFFCAVQIYRKDSNA